jgi:Secretion system C-terminal sorting domain
MRIFIVCLLILSFIDMVKAQYFNSKYTLGSPSTYVNCIVSNDSSFYLCGIVTPEDSVYQGKLCVSNFDFAGNLMAMKYFELDTFSSYQPSNHTAVRKVNSINICGGLGQNGQSSEAFSAEIKTNPLGISIMQYSDTVAKNFFLISSVTLPSHNRIYLGDYETQQFGVGYFIIKTDSDGNESWRKYYPIMSSWQVPSTITQIHNGNLLIGSQRGNYRPGTAFSSFTQIIEIDTFGNQVKYWEDDTSSAAGRSFSPCAIVELSNSDRIYASGYLDSSEVFASQFTTWAFQRGYIVRIDSTNTKIWEIKLGQSSTITSINQMKLLNDGNFLAVGCGVDSIDNPTNPFQAGWIIKFTQYGQILWQRQYYNVKFFNYLYDFIELGNGDIVACGQCIDNSASENNQQAWVLHLDINGCLVPGGCTSGISDSQSKSGIKIYPNPSSTIAFVDYSDLAIPTTIKIYNALGQSIHETIITNGSGTQQIMVQQWPSGFYSYRQVSANHGELSGTFVVCH